MTTYEVRTLLLNGVSVSDTCIGVDTRTTLVGEVFNAQNICWIPNTVLIQF